MQHYCLYSASSADSAGWSCTEAVGESEVSDVWSLDTSWSNQTCHKVVSQSHKDTLYVLCCFYNCWHVFLHVQWWNTKLHMFTLHTWRLQIQKHNLIHPDSRPHHIWSWWSLQVWGVESNAAFKLNIFPRCKLGAHASSRAGPLSGWSSFCPGESSFLFTFGVLHLEHFEVGWQKIQLRYISISEKRQQ